MTAADWVSCSIAFLALLLAVPGCIHTINSRLKLSVSVLEIKKQTHNKNFSYYFYLCFKNPNSESITILSVEVLTNNGFKTLSPEIAKNLTILLSKEHCWEQAYFFLANENPIIKSQKIKLKIITEAKTFFKKLKLENNSCYCKN